MKPTTQIQKEDRKRRRAAEKIRCWIEQLRRRHMYQERDRRRKWLLFLLLWALESKPAQMFFPSPDLPLSPAPEKAKKRKSEKNFTNAEETRTDDERRFLFDYAPRRGEENAEVMDGLTWTDIVALNRIHCPYLFKTAPIPGMPDRYKDNPPHVWSLLDHIGSDYHREDAITALKLLVDKEAHDWIDACSTGANGNSWKDLRLVHQRTPQMTIAEFPRAAARWREELRRETEEDRKNRPKRDDEDNGLSPK